MNTHDTLRYDPDIGYTFMPNIKARVPFEDGAYLIATNRLGFRSDEVPDVVDGDVLVFGDSFTAGDGVSNGKRWSDELGRTIGGVRFHNFGLPGTGTDQHYLAWRKFASDRRPRLLVVAVLVENIRRITAAWRPAEAQDGRVLFRAKPYFTLADGALVRHHDPVPPEPAAPEEVTGAYSGGRFPVLRQLANQLGIKQLVQQLTSYQPVPDYDTADTDGWQLMSAILERWSAECDCPMAIVPLPLYQHVEETADAASYQQRFQELGARIGRPILDILPELRSYDRATRRGFRFARDIHLTPEGHRAVAKALAPKLAALLSN